MRWKGGERDSKEVRCIEINRVERNMQRLSEEGIERYMESLCGDGKRERYIEVTKMKMRSQTDGDNYKDEKKK